MSGEATMAITVTEADTCEDVAWGYTVDDLHKFARIASRLNKARAIGYGDRFEVALVAATEALLTATEWPAARELTEFAAKAVNIEVEAHLRHHGKRHNERAFSVVWDCAHEPPFDERMCESIAVKQVFARMSDLQVSTLRFRAHFSTNTEAAEAAGTDPAVFRDRLRKARNRFATLWYDQESAPRNRNQIEACRLGRLTETELIQVAVPVVGQTPEAVYQAKTVAVEGISEILADAMRQGAEPAKAEDAGQTE